MIVLTVDCEAVNQYGRWCAIAVLVASYPNGHILGKLEIYTERKQEEFDAPSLRWWAGKTEAYTYIVKRAKQDTRTDNEKEIALLRFIRQMHEKFPRLQIVSDNAGFDIKILDVLAEKHKFPRISYRNQEGLYTHPKCAYTKKKTIETRQHPLACMIAEMFGPPQYLRPLDQPLADIPHTPLFDAQKILREYFDAIDIEQFNKDGIVPHRFMRRVS